MNMHPRRNTVLHSRVSGFIKECDCPLNDWFDAHDSRNQVACCVHFGESRIALIAHRLDSELPWHWHLEGIRFPDGDVYDDYDAALAAFREAEARLLQE